MREYPATLTIGVTRQTVYELGGDMLLLEYAPDAADDRIDSHLENTRAGRLKHRWKADHPIATQLRIAKLRCARATARPGTLSELARALVGDTALVARATPVYVPSGRDESAAATPRLDMFIVRLKDGVPPSALDDIATAVGARRHPEREPRRPEYGYFLHEDARGDADIAFETLARLRARPDVAWAEFDWLTLAPFQSAPNDTYYAQQWNMQRVNAPASWARGGPLQRVAVTVIDDNVQRDHPDLPPIPAHKTLDLGGPSQPEGSTPTLHGTAMAGIIAAKRGNNLGIAGMAGLCDLRSVRLALAPPWSKIADGLFWAADQGSRVVSISLGALGASEYVSEAIEYAWQRGVVLCVSSGSHGGGQVDFPASHPRVIAVGATDKNDRRKLAGSGGTSWESQYGPELAVMAPGVECWTTDESGARGVNPGIAGVAGDAAGNYTGLGDGTSIAAPHVAGLAALILMRYPLLSNEQVREAIERTCRKVHQAEYGYADARPHGGWSEQMGYGLIDCDAALTYAGTLRPAGHGRPARPQGCAFTGYIGHSARPGYLRLYCAPDLAICLELRADDIVSMEPTGQAGAGPARTRVTMRRGATVLRVTTAPRRA